MRLFNLFIDETGNVNPLDTTSVIYVLCGCAIDRELRESLKIRADQIKFKYWGRTDIIFHSRELGKKLGDFQIFHNHPDKYNNLISDLFSFLKEFNFTIFVIVCDKTQAKSEGWNSIKVTKDTAHILFFHYLVWLLGMRGDRGNITIESATAEKDRFYLNEFSYFLSPGVKEITVDPKKVKSTLTSISFVTKLNADIEEQIADIFAYAAKCKFNRQNGIATYKTGTYEDRLIRVLDKKLFQKPKIAKAEKMKLYTVIDSFCVLPKK